MTYREPTNDMETVAIDSVLVADDSIVQRADVVRVCRELGIPRIYEAAHGLEALALLETAAPAVLILDLEMPTMDGPVLLRRLSERGIRAPIILMSSRDRALLRAVYHLGSALGLSMLGITQKPLNRATLARMLHRADSAEAQRDTPHPTAEIGVNDLRAAIEDDLISVHYQPQIDIRTLTVHGVEALARWTHPTLGVIAPDRFIPLAEQSGLIHDLTLKVLHQAIVQALRWSAQDINLRIAVNLSPVLLDRADLFEKIVGLQQSYGIAAERIVIEVTESSLLQNVTEALSALSRLRLRGFGLSLDDYGTGFSSLQQLARIPFSELKIDRSFIRGLCHRESLRIMVRSTVSMANELGLATVAEGVSAEDELHLLQELGCTHAQGWLFAKALPIDELTQWLQQNQIEGTSRSPVPAVRGLCAIRPPVRMLAGREVMELRPPSPDQTSEAIRPFGSHSTTVLDEMSSSQIGPSALLNSSGTFMGDPEIGHDGR